MSQKLATISLLVPDYDEAIDYYVGTLGFSLLEDSDLGGGKRWVRVAPQGKDGNTTGAVLLLAKAANDAQRAQIGTQAGGRVFLFLETDDFCGDYSAYKARGVEFLEEPRQEPYGWVAVFRDKFGSLWDFIQPSATSS